MQRVARSRSRPHRRLIRLLAIADRARGPPSGELGSGLQRGVRGRLGDEAVGDAPPAARPQQERQPGGRLRVGGHGRQDGREIAVGDHDIGDGRHRRGLRAGGEDDARQAREGSGRARLVVTADLVRVGVTGQQDGTTIRPSELTGGQGRPQRPRDEVQDVDAGRFDATQGTGAARTTAEAVARPSVRGRAGRCCGGVGGERGDGPTGGPDGPGLGPPEPLVGRLTAWSAIVASDAAALGRPVDVDPLGLLVERAAIAGLRRQGTTSCGGATRLLPTADGWVAVALARPHDLEAVPAWLEVDRGSDAANVWDIVVPTVALRRTRSKPSGAPASSACPSPPSPRPPWAGSGQASRSRRCRSGPRVGGGAGAPPGGGHRRGPVRAVGRPAVRASPGRGRRRRDQGGVGDPARRRPLRPLSLLRPHERGQGVGRRRPRHTQREGRARRPRPRCPTW